MGIRYTCDVCGKEYDVKGGFSPTGYPAVAEVLPDRWAVISYLAPKKASAKEKFVGMYSERMSEGFLVCSQVCAEKALDEVKEHLRLAFEKLAE